MLRQPANGEGVLHRDWHPTQGSRPCVFTQKGVKRPRIRPRPIGCELPEHAAGGGCGGQGCRSDVSRVGLTAPNLRGSAWKASPGSRKGGDDAEGEGGAPTVRANRPQL